ncbi:MAG: radical SAM protein [Deltaproteobacteria bacterium]|nr:radical SAM protein [Deltaproteobacteria bacterium]
MQPPKGSRKGTNAPDPPIAAETGPEKLFFFPAKTHNYLEEKSPDPSYPISLELSLTHLCNLHCLYCSDRRIRLSPDRLNLSLLEKLFVDLKGHGTRGITIEGGGEPTLSPIFEDTIEIASSLGLALGLITNGTNLFERWGKDLYSSFQWIRVSLDAATPQSFTALKGSDLFEEVMRNIEILASSNSKQVLGIGYVLTRLNDDLKSLKELSRTLKKIGCNYLHIRPVVDHSELASTKSYAHYLSLKEDEDLGYNVNLGPLKENSFRGNLGLPCYAHSLTTVIGADGLVWLCGRLNCDPTIAPIGNLEFQTFQDIWLGKERAKQDLKVKSPSYCLAHCPMCRLTKYNITISALKNIKTRDFI